jgi:hypothetical protein
MMMEKQLVDRSVDRDRFRLLFTNSRPQMPEDSDRELAFVPTRQLMREQKEASSETRSES